MVINHTNRWIYFAAPKTGSSTLHYLFAFPPFNGHAPTMGVDSIAIPGQHIMEVPPDCENYKIIISVRNPYSRAVSLYEHFKQQLPNLPEGESFPIYIEKILLPKENDFFGWTCYQWYKQLPRIDHVIRLECLYDDVSKIDLVSTPFSIPWENRLTPSAWQNYYRFNPGTMDLIKQWGDEDFDHYGYGR